jgi:hypothetical protein
MPDQPVAIAVVVAAGAVGLAVTAPSGAAEEPVTTSSGDVAELLDVDVDQHAGLVMLVAPDRLAGRPINIAQAADPAADQNGMDGGGSQTDLGSDLGWPQPLGPAQMHDPAHDRRWGPSR